jgi:hypothetical protein
VFSSRVFTTIAVGVSVSAQQRSPPRLCYNPLSPAHATVTMDALFAKTLGDAALVQTRACDDPKKGKGVFALVPLDAGTVALRDRPGAFCTSHELSSLALEDPGEALPVPHRTCATCSGFVGTLQSQLATLLDARKASGVPAATAKPAKKGKKQKSAEHDDTSDAPPSDVSALRLPFSAAQPTTLRAAFSPGGSSKKSGKALTFCSKPCAAASEHKLQAQTKPWSAFAAVLGEIPRADRRSLLLAARLVSRAVADGPGSDASEGARLLQSDYIWTLLDRDADATQGVRDALALAWPALKEALVAAHGAARVARAEKTPLAGFEGAGTKPGLATFEGFAALCGAAQRNGMSVKIPNPLMRYVATTPEAGAAPAPLKPAVKWLLSERDEEDKRRVAREEAAVFGASGDGSSESDDDSDSDSDEDDALDFGDEQMEIDWGHDCQFEASSVFPPARGAAVFPLASGLNHSCAPNCEVAFAEDNAVFVVTTRAVALGEELTISYVDASGTDDERREELQETYGFECRCARCERGGGEAKKPKKTAPAAKPKEAAKKAAPAKKGAKKAAPAAKKGAKKAAPAAKKTAKKAAPAAKKGAKKPAPVAKPKRKAAGAAASAAKKPRTVATKK